MSKLVCDIRHFQRINSMPTALRKWFNTMIIGYLTHWHVPCQIGDASTLWGPGLLNHEGTCRLQQICHRMYVRLCPSCNEIEDEKHFVLDCPIYRDERVKLYDKIHTVNPTFVEMVPDSKFIFLFTSNHRQIINWFGKFIYVCFEKRSKFDRGQISRKVNWLNVAQYWPVCTNEISQCVFWTL